MIVSADDFGISASVSEGILELIAKKRITSVSCMVTEDILDSQIKELKRHQESIDIGLHLVCTEAKSISNLDFSSGLVNDDGNFYSFISLARQAYCRKLNQQSIYSEIQSQLKLFIKLFGRPPDFIDGHQHVQQLPQIRNAVALIASKNESIKYIRVANLPISWLLGSTFEVSPLFVLENLVIAVPARKMMTELDKKKVRYNRYLLGYYDHSTDVNFSKIFEHYLTLNPQHNDIFFCHPGHVDDTLENRDRLTVTRKDNLDFLLSDEFLKICAFHNINLNRF